MSDCKALSLTDSQILTLSKIINIQLDISDDTVLDDVHVNKETTLDYDSVQRIRKSTDERISILLMLTRLQILVRIPNIALSEQDTKRLCNEVDCYLGMITDMVEEDNDTTLIDRIQHIVDVKLLLTVLM